MCGIIGTGQGSSVCWRGIGRLFRDGGGDGLVGEGRQEDAVGGFKPRLVDVEGC